VLIGSIPQTVLAIYANININININIIINGLCKKAVTKFGYFAN